MAGVTADNKPLSEAEYKTISVSATITDDFDSMSEEEKANAPILVTGKRIVDFGIVTGSQKVRQIIYIANVGYSPLIIRKVRNENAVITAKPKKTTLKTGTIYSTYHRDRPQTCPLKFIAERHIYREQRPHKLVAADTYNSRISITPNTHRKDGTPRERLPI